MNEEDAFWCLVYIVEQLMPPQFYCKQLVGAQVDQAVFKELVCEKLPDLAIHLEAHGVDPALFSINWFLCLFVDSLPVNTYLHIWDAFLFEGNKVLFRYALGILSYMEDKLMKQGDYMSIFNTFRTEVQSLVDVKRLTMIAFQELNPFPLRIIATKREHHHKILKVNCLKGLKGLFTYF
ncbi:TBC1 domain family member 2B-like [Eurytemora carolleeae]|uniref:TBC1 domain family member 2B-like n=1 Tax=Eurytemora carolleeae TaxID=1294199 RepID=UPI000C78C653|nr:TBC1 domain family member 2B-like [Eurytemora carolleeae]|eukprot:XP_023328213.1 TBC1 domain family member 2B-like [Eurytemora affinis]